jgi:hypothetical protein
MLHRVYGKPRDEAMGELLGRQSAGMPSVRELYVSPTESGVPGTTPTVVDGKKAGFSVGRAGLEPATYGLKVRSSTD